MKCLRIANSWHFSTQNSCPILISVECGLDRLIDEVGEDETHPLASLMELVGVLIERYEDEHVPEFTSEAEG